MIISKKNILALIELLKGSCISMSEAIDILNYDLKLKIRQEDLSKKDIANINSEIFQCFECGWWEDLTNIAFSEEPELTPDENYCQDCWDSINE